MQNRANQPAEAAALVDRSAITDQIERILRSRSFASKSQLAQIKELKAFLGL